jgi:hypothetical protein
MAVVALISATRAIYWAWAVTRRRRPPVAVPAPVLLPPTSRTVDEDLELIYTEFGAWREYVYGSRERHTTVARAFQFGTKHWKVFCLFYERECGPYPVLASAYVTVPNAQHPTDPEHVCWHFTGHIHDTVAALVKVSEDAFSQTPYRLPESLRPPRLKPVLFRPGKT